MNRLTLSLATLLSISLVFTGCKRDVQPDPMPDSPSFEETREDDHAVGADREPTTAAQAFSLRMADGTELESASYDILIEGLSSLDTDNFFLVLSSGDDFAQTSVTENGYIVEYKEGGNHYTSADLISEDEMMRFFSMYFNGEDGWKGLFDWKRHERPSH